MRYLRKLSVFAVCLALLVSTLPLGALSAAAVTVDDLNADGLFLTQEGKYTCTLASCAMMMRRYSLLRGDAQWNTITESSIRSVAWLEGVGIYWSFKYSTGLPSPIQVGRNTLPGGNANEAILKNLLKEHPEGVVIYHYSSSVSHAVLLTDYTDGVFYCADPSPGMPPSRIPLDTAYVVRVNNATAYWYVTSPAVPGPTPNPTPEPDPDPEPEPEPEPEPDPEPDKVWGDANADGVLNNKDLGILQLLLNDYTVVVNTLLLDVNKDGRINNRDLGLIQYLINGWDIEIRKRTV